ncbi:MAG: DUF4893 domain-containing protein [Alphaproteobacteria bacterium]|nr:MAG: DUF4893 domain-containing protein [Alphaproteobacteria bacterium]
MTRSILPLAVLALAACQQPIGGARPAPGRSVVIVEEAEDWTKAASVRDSAAVETLPARWTAALAGARRSFAGKVASEGDLLDPAAALERAAPTPGSYRCRAVRIGGKPAYSASRPGFCYVTSVDDQLSFASEIPGRRLGGYLWDVKDRRRLVFLGSAIPGKARIAPAYGSSPAGDISGLFERIGEFRFRLTLPDPADAAALIVLDITAAPRA